MNKPHDPIQQALQTLAQFVKMESFAGLVMVLVAFGALIVANSPLQSWYEGLIRSQLYIGFNDLKLSKPLLLWINDGLMAIYFLLIGLELKREVIEGQLSKPSQIVLPGVAALGGVVVPAFIYYAFNRSSPLALTGWAIPTATDIAFALGVLALLGNRVPGSLKIFLMTIAIFDDLFAILIIAVFYSSNLSALSLGLASIAVVLLVLCNRLKVASLSVYGLIGLLLWFFVLKSGVHATLAGVILAFAIPNKANNNSISPAKELESKLHYWIIFFIVPIFAFANSGINFGNLSINTLLTPVTLGITCGLFFGKQLGIFSLSFLFIKLKLAQLPENTHWKQLYGVAVLAGIGFTMSLFISSLAFEHHSQELIIISRVGILAGSVLSALVGYALLHVSLKRTL